MLFRSELLDEDSPVDLHYTPPDLPEIPYTVSTAEARIISGGIDKMPEARRQQALAIMKAAFAEYADFFKEETDK